MTEDKLFDKQTRQQIAELRLDGWPEVLIDATLDTFDYALGLREGTVFRFEHAEPEGQRGWVRLSGLWRWHETAEHDEFSFDRGITVRLDQIAWVCKAPLGS